MANIGGFKIRFERYKKMLNDLSVDPHFENYTLSSVVKKYNVTSYIFEGLKEMNLIEPLPLKSTRQKYKWIGTKDISDALVREYMNICSRISNERHDKDAANRYKSARSITVIPKEEIDYPIIISADGGGGQAGGMLGRTMDYGQYLDTNKILEKEKPVILKRRTCSNLQREDRYLAALEHIFVHIKSKDFNGQKVCYKFAISKATITSLKRLGIISHMKSKVYAWIGKIPDLEMAKNVINENKINARAWHNEYYRKDNIKPEQVSFVDNKDPFAILHDVKKEEHSPIIEKVQEDVVNVVTEDLKKISKVRAVKKEKVNHKSFSLFWGLVTIKF